METNGRFAQMTTELMRDIDDYFAELDKADEIAEKALAHYTAMLKEAETENPLSPSRPSRPSLFPHSRGPG